MIYLYLNIYFEKTERPINSFGLYTANTKSYLTGLASIVVKYEDKTNKNKTFTNRFESFTQIKNY